jgi:NAD(P)-binding Rossmann-like domain
MLFKVAATALLALSSVVEAFAPSTRSFSASTQLGQAASENVAQTENTSRGKVMTFSYDMSLEPKYEKPTYPGTGNGLSGDSGEYDVIVIGSGMGGLTCGAMSAKYGDKVLVLESHIKCGGSAHTFSRMHKGQKYSFEVGPSIFEGLDRPSLNPLRMIFDLLDEQMPVKTYTGLGYWTPTGYWRFPIGSKSMFEDLLMEQAEDGPKAVEVSLTFEGLGTVDRCYFFRLTSRFVFVAGMECSSPTSQDPWWFHDGGVAVESPTRRWISRDDCRESPVRRHTPRCLFGSTVDL